jgi:hypothetical protein
MATEQDPFNRETSPSHEQQTLADFAFEVARGLEDIVLGAYTPAELDDIIISALQNKQTDIRLQAVVSDSAHYWLLSVTHRNRSPETQNRNVKSGVFYKEITVDLLSDVPHGHGVTGHRFVLDFHTGALSTESTELFVTEGFSTEIKGSPRVLYDNSLLTDITEAKKLCSQLERLLRNGDNPEMYVTGKKADRLIRHHNDYFNL